MMRKILRALRVSSIIHSNSNYRGWSDNVDKHCIVLVVGIIEPLSTYKVGAWVTSASISRPITLGAKGLPIYTIQTWGKQSDDTLRRIITQEEFSRYNLSISDPAKNEKYIDFPHNIFVIGEQC